MYNHKFQAEQEQQGGSKIYIFIIIFNATAATGCTALPPSVAELNIALSTGLKKFSVVWQKLLATNHGYKDRSCTELETTFAFSPRAPQYINATFNHQTRLCEDKINVNDKPHIMSRASFRVM